MTPLTSLIYKSENVVTDNTARQLSVFDVSGITFTSVNNAITFGLNMKAIAALSSTNLNLMFMVSLYQSTSLRARAKFCFRTYSNDLQVQVVATDYMDGNVENASAWTTISSNDFNFFTYWANRVGPNNWNFYAMMHPAWPPSTSVPATIAGTLTGKFFTDSISKIGFEVYCAPQASDGMKFTYQGTVPFLLQTSRSSGYVPTMTKSENALSPLISIPGNSSFGNWSYSYDLLFDLSLDSVLQQDLTAYHDYLSSLINSSHPKSGTSTGGTPGSPGYTYPSSGTFGDQLVTAFNDLASAIDGAVAFPTFSWSAPWPLDGVADILSSGLNRISSSLEDVSDGVIGSFSAVIQTIPKLFDDVNIMIVSNLNRIPNFIHSIIDVAVDSWWDLTPYVNEIFLNPNIKVPAGFKEPLLGILPPDGSFSFPAGSVKIPKRFKFSLGSFNYYLSMIDIPLSWVPFPIRNQMVPTSDTWKGRRSSDVRVPTFISDSTGIGVPVIDFIGALTAYGGGLGSLGVLAYYAPNLVAALLKKIFTLAEDINQPANSDLALAMHPKSSYNSDWKVTAALDEQVLLNSDSRLPDSVMSSKEDVDNVDTSVNSANTDYKKGLKRLYSIGKINSLFKLALPDLETWLSTINVDVSVDELIVALDSMISSSVTVASTDSTTSDEIKSILDLIDQNVRITEQTLGLRNV